MRCATGSARARGNNILPASLHHSHHVTSAKLQGLSDADRGPA
jgi:hypothetical protein